MRKFSSYGPVDRNIHYYAPREELIKRAYAHLTGDIPEEGGHYITVWAPRQTGKTWVMQEAMRRIREREDFEIGILSMQAAKKISSDERMLEFFVRSLREWFGREMPEIETWDSLYRVFSKHYFPKPVILILDEFDALGEGFINSFANGFRDIHMRRQNEADRPSGEKSCLLHGLALIGVRSVLGIGNVSGSPFNVQRSLRIPNLTFGETAEMFKWHERETGQKIEDAVLERLFCETRGQPGLTCWFGELLTEGFEDWKPDYGRPLTLGDFERVFAAAVDVLPNTNVLNILSKAREKDYKDRVLELFKTGQKIRFRYDDPGTAFLYTNGVIDREQAGTETYYIRFSSPFVQKRLFNYFARELFAYTGKLAEPFEDLSDAVAESELHIGNLMRRFEAHLAKNRDWMLKDAPRRSDMRIYEAVYHFALYRWLCDFLEIRHARVWPEFPTGNGKVDILIRYAGTDYAVEVKSYTHAAGYKEALEQAAEYGRQLGLPEISLVFFVEYADDENRKKYETPYTDAKTGVRVMPVFVETGK